MHPDHAAVPCQEAVHRAKRLRRGAGSRELHVPTLAVLRMELPVPQHGVLQPFLLGKTQKLLDLRAYIQLVETFIEGRQEGYGWDLFDEGAVARLRLAELGLGRRNRTPLCGRRWLGRFRQRLQDRL